MPTMPPAPFVVSRRQAKRDAGEGYLTDGGRPHIFVYDIDNRFAHPADLRGV